MADEKIVFGQNDTASDDNLYPVGMHLAAGDKG
jgi:hypothetical protein